MMLILWSWEHSLRTTGLDLCFSIPAAMRITWALESASTQAQQAN